MADKFPAIKGRILTPGTYTLRQSCGEGSIGDTKIGLTTTGGLGGFALYIEVKVLGRETVYVEYDGQEIVEEVARIVARAAGEGDT